MKKLTTLAISFLMMFSFGFADENESAKDTINFEEYDFGVLDYSYWKNFGSTSTINYILYDAPTIDVYYGNSQAVYEHKNFNSTLADNGLVAANLGFTSFSEFRQTKNVFKYKSNYLSFSNLNRELASDDKDVTDEFSTRIWRIGINGADGYGWKFSDNIYLALYHSTGIGWATIDSKHNSTDADEIAAMKVFGKQVRYGKQFAGGAKFYITKHFSLNAEYERTMIYPRHLFWKDVAGSIIEGSAQGLTSWFTGKIAKEVPVAAPIVHFVLKNAVSYGFYELYKENMNWPFKTAAPFMNDNFKVGVGFVF